MICICLLCRFPEALQATLIDCGSFDFVAFSDDVLVATEVDISGCNVFEAVAVTRVFEERETRIALARLRGEESISALCCHQSIAECPQILTPADYSLRTQSDDLATTRTDQTQDHQNAALASQKIHRIIHPTR